MKKTAGVKIKSAVRAGDNPNERIASNHNASKAGVKIKTAVRAGSPPGGGPPPPFGGDPRIATNHNTTKIRRA